MSDFELAILAAQARADESVNEFFEPGTFAVPLGKKAAGRLLDGVEHNGVPA